MAIGDEFNISQVRAFDWAELTDQSGLQRRLVAREMRRITRALRKALPALQAWTGYTSEEQLRIADIADFALTQAAKLDDIAKDLPDVLTD